MNYTLSFVCVTKVPIVLFLIARNSSPIIYKWFSVNENLLSEEDIKWGEAQTTKICQERKYYIRRGHNTLTTFTSYVLFRVSKLEGGCFLDEDFYILSGVYFVRYASRMFIWYKKRNSIQNIFSLTLVSSFVWLQRMTFHSGSMHAWYVKYISIGGTSAAFSSVQWDVIIILRSMICFGIAWPVDLFGYRH